MGYRKMPYRVKKAKKLGNSAGLLLSKRDLGKEFVVVPAEYKHRVDELFRTNALMEVLSNKELEKINEVLEKRYLKVKPRTSQQSMMRVAAERYCSLLAILDDRESLENLLYLIKGENLTSIERKIKRHIEKLEI